MSRYPVREASAWYHGSPLVLTELAAGSTITQWKQLAEAFSHKPSLLEYNEILGEITHNGVLDGRLYVVDEPVHIGVDVYPHPRSSMDEGVEWLTARPLKLKPCGGYDEQA